MLDHGEIDILEAAKSNRWVRWATYASVSIALTLILIKLFAWTMTESVAMLSTLADSLLDGLASVVTLFAVRHAQMPADREHRFGHGKAEALAALSQAAFVTGSAVVVLMQAGERILNPRPILRTDVGITVIVISILLTLALVLFQSFVVKKTDSVAITADSLHYKGDLLINSAVLAVLVAQNFVQAAWLDPFIGGGIAAYLVYGAWRISKTALDMLMDRELPDEDRNRIRFIALDHADVKSVHELRTRRAGQDVFIQMHLELDADISLKKAHVIADEVEERINAEFPGAEVLIHQDPEGLEEEHQPVGQR